MEYIKKNLGVYSALTEKTPGRAECVSDLSAAVKNSWLVFEVVPEIKDLKESTFEQLEQYSPKDCILASNSSSYKSGELIGKLQAETKTRVLSVYTRSPLVIEQDSLTDHMQEHPYVLDLEVQITLMTNRLADYMMPPEALVVELMTDGHTTPELIDFVKERHEDAGLHPIVALKESTGFVFNRIWAAIKRETIKVLQEGVSTPAEIDRVFMELYSAREGPCHMMDQVGLDTVQNIEEHYIKERNLGRSHADWLHKNYIEQGKLGNKSDKGGLYDVPAPGEQTKLFFLNLGKQNAVWKA